MVDEHVRAGGSAVVTTHALDLALDLATRVVVVSAGSIVVDANRTDVTRGDVEAAIAGVGG